MGPGVHLHYRACTTAPAPTWNARFRAKAMVMVTGASASWFSVTCSGQSAARGGVWCAAGEPT